MRVSKKITTVSVNACDKQHRSHDIESVKHNKRGATPCFCNGVSLCRGEYQAVIRLGAFHCSAKKEAHTHNKNRVASIGFYETDNRQSGNNSVNHNLVPCSSNRHRGWLLHFCARRNKYQKSIKHRYGKETVTLTSAEKKRWCAICIH